MYSGGRSQRYKKTRGGRRRSRRLHLRGEGMSSNKRFFGDLMRQAQAFQEKLAKVQEEAGQKVVEAASGGGMVTARANGRGELLSVKIEPEVLQSADAEMVGDLVVAAVNEALKKGKAHIEEVVKGMTGGMNLPGMF